MQTNKPEVKRYNITTDKYCYPVPYETEHGQWVKYSSYKDLQAECGALAEALEAIVSHHDEYFRDSSTESKMPWIEQARAALDAYRKGGE